jgi:mannose/cellobiose epimerase-like protein (N-acyl-D-glucosamine 2-epimerase family)
MTASWIDVDAPAGPRWTSQSSHRLWLLEEANRLLDFYQDASINPKGGFFDLDDFGAPLPTGWPPAPAPTRNLFQTTRIVHCYSIAHLMGRPGASRMVDHGMDFLWNGHRDSEHGGYHWSSGYKAPLNAAKVAYGHAFVLLAASSAKAAGHPDADRLLADISQVLDRHFWEEEYGAIREDFHPDWTPVENYRGQNSNMHLTEALMAAFEATGETLYLERAERVATLLIAKITAGNDWRLPEHYDERWQIDFKYDRDVFRPFGSTIGHWLEWSRLLLQLWALSGKRSDWMKEAAVTLFDKAVAEGWDAAKGGFYFTVGWDGKPVDRDRYWWPCTEGIGAAAYLADVTGEPKYEGWYRRIWDWCDEHLIDREAGSWRHQLNDDLEPVVDPWFGKPDLYHSLQATLIPLLPTTGSITHGLVHGRITL